MRFSKTLQKLEGQAGNGDESAGRTGRDQNAPQGLLANSDLRIGTPRLEIAKKPGLPAVSPKPDEATRDQREIESADFNCKFTVNPAKVNERLIAISDPHSSYCEEYRSLRTQVLHACQKRKSSSVVVLSVGSSEGKSVTALNLAWLLAQTEGVNALIIDGDLRSPSIESYLGFETEVGLSNVLEGSVPAKRAIIRLEPSGLHFLPAGSIRSDVAELISGQGFKGLLDELRGKFDFIIVDAPPLGLFSDAKILLNHADCGLLVARANRVRYGELNRILDGLPKDKLLGTVLNCSQEPMVGRDYYKDSRYSRY